MHPQHLLVTHIWYPIWYPIPYKVSYPQHLLVTYQMTLPPDPPHLPNQNVYDLESRAYLLLTTYYLLPNQNVYDLESGISGFTVALVGEGQHCDSTHVLGSNVLATIETTCNERHVTIPVALRHGAKYRCSVMAKNGAGLTTLRTSVDFVADLSLGSLPAYVASAKFVAGPTDEYTDEYYGQVRAGVPQGVAALPMAAYLWLPTYGWVSECWVCECWVS